ncbi:MAG TPA: Mut7-C RNAse domain-containing protein [Candidatus Binatia bacterium]|nr:Mut7-C RNAse domain-containing protein [Candidatus Binatia bacterium]
MLYLRKATAAVTPTPPPRFVADKTLGRLARWLRIVGCDVLYGSNFSGKGLLAAARSDQRIVLTRDRRLARRAHMPPFLLVEDDRFREQLRQVIAAFDIDPRAALFRRCVDCNAELVEIPREEAAPNVPEFVLATQRSFRRCPRCRHLYWDATHVARIRGELERMGLGEVRA